MELACCPNQNSSVRVFFLLQVCGSNSVSISRSVNCSEKRNQMLFLLHLKLLSKALFSATPPSLTLYNALKGYILHLVKQTRASKMQSLYDSSLVGGARLFVDSVGTVLKGENPQRS